MKAKSQKKISEPPIFNKKVGNIIRAVMLVIAIIILFVSICSQSKMEGHDKKGNVACRVYQRLVGIIRIP